MKNFIKSSIIFLALGAIIGILAINVIYYSNMTHWEIPQIEYYGLKRNIMSALIALVIIVSCHFISKIKINKMAKRFLIVTILILYGMVQLAWIVNTPAKQFADSLEVLRISEKMTNNTPLSEYQRNYLQYYPQQLTMSVFFNNIFYLSRSNNYIILEIINMISNVLMVIGLYLILLELEKKSKVNYVLFFVMTVLFVPIIFLTSFIYGDFIGLACSVWSILFYIKYIEKDESRYIAYIGILMSLACIVRMNYFIFVIAMVINLFIIRMDQSSLGIRGFFKYFVVCFLIIVIVFLPSFILKKAYAQKYGLDMEKSFSTIPYLYMGMSEGERANGWYNDEVGKIVFELMNSKDDTRPIMEDCKQKMKDRAGYMYRHPMYTYRFYRDKLITIWADPTMEYKFYNTYDVESDDVNSHPIVKEILFGKIYDYIVIYQKALITLIFIGALAAIIIKRKNMSNYMLLLYLSFLGGFIFHILWEAKSRYILPYIVVLIPNSCIGITALIDKLKDKKSENERQK